MKPSCACGLSAARGRSKRSEGKLAEEGEPVDAGEANNCAEVAEGQPDFRGVVGLRGKDLVQAIRGDGIPEGTRIRPWLILGSAADAVDAEFLRREGVSVVISNASELQPSPLPSVRHHVLPVADKLPRGEHQRDRLWEIHEVIAAVRDCHRRSSDSAAPTCLVHCMRGRSRSVVACLAHLMWAEGLSLREAFDEVYARRPIVGPHRDLRKQLLAFEASEFGQQSIPCLEAWGGEYGAD